MGKWFKRSFVSLGFLLFCCTFFSSQARSQGSLVVMPLSKAVVESSEVLNFYLHNQVEDTLAIAYEPKCDIEGKEIAGHECNLTFDVVYDKPIKDGAFIVPKGGKVAATLRLRNKDLKFAIFKPLFTPNLATKPKDNLITFQMRYQPGYLYLVHPAEEKIGNIDFAIVETESARRMKFKLAIGSLTVPQVIGVTVKVLRKADMKLTRLLRLASDKIIDPKRKTLELEADFAEKSDKTPVCYEMYIASLGLKSIDKRTNCL